VCVCVCVCVCVISIWARGFRRGGPGPGADVLRAQTWNGGSVVDLMAWFLCRGFIQVLDGSSACAGQGSGSACQGRARAHNWGPTCSTAPSLLPVVAGATLSAWQVSHWGGGSLAARRIGERRLPTRRLVPEAAPTHIITPAATPRAQPISFALGVLAMKGMSAPILVANPDAKTSCDVGGGEAR